MKGRIIVFCLLLAIVFFILGCNSGINEDSYKYKIYIASGDNSDHTLYSNDFNIDERGFLTVVNPEVPGESKVIRAICSPGTYFILER
jgi:hypothetical protein